MSNREAMKQWGQELARHRLVKHLTQAELSDKTRLSQGTISHAETGENIVRPGTYKVLKKYLPDLPPPPIFNKPLNTPEKLQIEQLTAELASAKQRNQELEPKVQEVQELRSEITSLRHENIQLREQLVSARAELRKRDEVRTSAGAKPEPVALRSSMLPPPGLAEVLTASGIPKRDEPKRIPLTPQAQSLQRLQPVLILLDRPALKRIGRFVGPLALFLGFSLGMATSLCSGGGTEVEEKKCTDPRQTWKEEYGMCVGDPTKMPFGGKMPDCRENGYVRPCCNPETDRCENN